jgi:hypothetical protein
LPKFNPWNKTPVKDATPAAAVAKAAPPAASGNAEDSKAVVTKPAAAQESKSEDLAPKTTSAAVKVKESESKVVPKVVTKVVFKAAPKAATKATAVDGGSRPAPKETVSSSSATPAAEKKSSAGAPAAPWSGPAVKEEKKRAPGAPWAVLNKEAVAEGAAAAATGGTVDAVDVDDSEVAEAVRYIYRNMVFCRAHLVHMYRCDSVKASSSMMLFTACLLSHKISTPNRICLLMYAFVEIGLWCTYGSKFAISCGNCSL